MYECTTFIYLSMSNPTQSYRCRYNIMVRAQQYYADVVRLS